MKSEGIKVKQHMRQSVVITVEHAEQHMITQTLKIL